MKPRHVEGILQMNKNKGPMDMQKISNTKYNEYELDTSRPYANSDGRDITKQTSLLKYNYLNKNDTNNTL